MSGSRAVIRWIATWAALGLAAGVVLMAGDAGHLPVWLLPPLLTGAGAAAGVLSWLMLIVVRRLIPEGPGQAATRSAHLSVHLMATAAGAASMALLAAALGITQPLASVVGAVAGLLASFVSGSSGRSRNSH